LTNIEITEDKMVI